MDKNMRLIAKWWFLVMLYWGVGIGLFVGTSVNLCPKDRIPYSTFAEAFIWPTMITGVFTYAMTKQGAHPEPSCTIPGAK